MADAKFWIPFLKWDAYVADSPEEVGGDEDTDPDKRGIHGGMRITASLSKGDARAIRASTTPPQLFALGEQEARLDDGRLKLTADQAEFGLLAKCSVLDIPEDVDLVYTFTPHHVTYNGGPQDLPSITVKAPEIPDDYDVDEDGPWEQNLATMEWLNPSTARAGGFIIRQVPDDYELDGSTLYFTLDGNPFGTGVELPGGGPIPVEMLTNATTVGKAVAKAVDAAAARAATETARDSHGLPSYLVNFQSSNFLKWKKALVDVRNGVADARLLIVGDSTAAGVGSSTTTIPANKSWPAQLAALMNDGYVPATKGLAIPKSDSSAQPNDARWSSVNWSAGPFSGISQIGWGNKNTFWYTTTIGATLTYADGVYADTYDIYYLDASGNRYITAQASGGTPVNALMVEAALTVKKVTVTAAQASTTNVVTITMGATGGSNTRAFILGVEPSLSTAKQVRIGNAGVSGSQSSGWVSYPGGNPANTYGALDSIKAYAPHLTIIDLGINDAGAGVSQAAYAANLAQVIAAAQVSGDVILKTMLPSSVGATATLEAAYVAGIKTLGLPVIDVFSRIGAYSVYNAAGYMSDTVHGNDYSYGDEAAMVLAGLMIGIGSAGGASLGAVTDKVKAAVATDAMTLTNKTLASPLMGAVKDVNGNDILDLNAVSGAFNYLQIANAASATPSIKAVGTGSNVNIAVQPKGTGVVRLATSNGLAALQTGAPVASSVNYIEVTQATTTNAPKVAAAGTDTNVDLLLAGKGTGRPAAAALKLTGGSGTATVSAGTGSPEGAVTATMGSLYLNTSGGAGTSMYVKESGAGNTGWVAK